MAAIDYATCGINDVIAHSPKLDPKLLADRLRFHALQDADLTDANLENVHLTQGQLDQACGKLHAPGLVLDKPCPPPVAAPLHPSGHEFLVVAP